MGEPAVVLTTCGSQEEARKIADGLLERRLCACTNIISGVESVYRWHGKIERAHEWLLIIKTRSELAEQVQAAIEQLHSYETPEAVVLPVSGGLRPYLDWIIAETGAPEPRS